MRHPPHRTAPERSLPARLFDRLFRRTPNPTAPRRETDYRSVQGWYVGDHLPPGMP